MKNYHFRFGETEHVAWGFAICADSKQDAVELANDRLSGWEERSEPFIRVGLHHTRFFVDDSFRVSEDDIKEVTEPEHIPPRSARKIMHELGYALDLGSGEQERDELPHREEAAFEKHFTFEEAGSKYMPEGAFRIKPRYDHNYEEHVYYIDAYTRGMRVVDIPDDPHNRAVTSSGIRANFSDEWNHDVVEDELEEAIRDYEDRFVEALEELYDDKVVEWED